MITFILAATLFTTTESETWKRAEVAPAHEADSYTPYPGCAWTASGTIRFNRDYRAPTLRRELPSVKLYIGTFNTNRGSYIDQILTKRSGRSSLIRPIPLWRGWLLFVPPKM